MPPEYVDKVAQIAVRKLNEKVKDPADRILSLVLKPGSPEHAVLTEQSRHNNIIVETKNGVLSRVQRPTDTTVFYRGGLAARSAAPDLFSATDSVSMRSLQ